MTPREIAHDIALKALRYESIGLTPYKLSPSQRVKTRQWIARLHNKLLAESGLTGTPMEENP